MGSILDDIPGDDWQDVHVDAQKIELESLAATALGITVRKLRNNNHKTWLKLGGDSLAAVNLMGACHEAGIELNIPDILKAESVDELLRKVAENHRRDGRHAIKTNGEEKSHDSRRQPWSQELRSVLNGSVDEVEAVGPCSPMQENFIAVQSQDPLAYQMRLAVKIGSAKPEVVVTVETAQRAWKQVVGRHAALRTSFIESVDRPGQMDQVIWRNAEPQISVLSALSEAEWDTTTTSFGGHKYKFPYQLTLAPTTEGQLILRLVISHVLVDGVSIELLFRDLFRALAGLSLSDGQGIEYGDYLEAQRPDTSQEAYEYWSRYTGAIEGTFLKPATLGLNTKPTGLYTIEDEVIFSSDIRNEEEDRNKHVTLVNACQVAYALVLGSYTGTSDVCFAYTASGRQKRVTGLQGAVGNFVNTLPCRINLTADPTIAQALEGVQADFLRSLPFQGAGLTNKTQANGLAVRQLADSLLSFQRGVPEEELVQAGFSVDILSWEAPSDYNYTMAITLNEARVGLRLSVWESLTPKEDAETLMQLFRDSLQFVLGNADQPCSDFVGIAATDRARILASNEEPYHLPQKCVHEQVRSVARQQRSSTAIHAWDGQLTYGELDDFSDRLGLHLLRIGLSVEDKVGIYMDKSRWAPVAMLAVLKAGGVVVPLGNQDPLNRISTITSTASISIVVADRVHAARLEAAGILSPHERIIPIDETFLSQQPPASDAAMWPDITPHNSAWIVFTSGSTGIPKGVVLEHKTLCAPMYVQAARYNLGSSTRALQFSAHTFDVVVKDIFTTLSFGGCVCIPSEHERLNDLAGAINSMRVNFATLTPTVASLLNPADVSTLRTIVATGEALSGATLQPWLEDGRVTWFNGYGPSECSHVSSINGPITRADDASNIGLPAANRLWIVSPRNIHRLSPVGAVGELLIEGAIAREYLNNPEGTAAAFVVDPGFIKQLGITPGRRMYRTGDLVRQKKDGTLVYLGRKDTQIKIRGQRVEVGEIESCISRLLPDSPLVYVGLLGPTTLVAAIETKAESLEIKTVPGTPCPVSDALRGSLRNVQAGLLDEVPLYMVPAYFVPFTRLPTNASGKLDRRKTQLSLERLTESELRVIDPSNGRRPVSTQTGKRLQAIWAAVLGRPATEIGDDDHFMQLGGDSVSAMRMVGIARKRGVLLSVADILEHPRLADMTRIVEEYEKKAENVAREDTVPFQLWRGFLTATNAEKEARLVAVADQCSVTPNHIVDVYPASPLQEGLIAMTSQFQGTYVAQHVFRMDDRIDLQKFQEAWETVAASLCILRTRIVYTRDTGSVQAVIREAPQFTTAWNLDEFLAQDRLASFAYGTPLHRFAIIEDRPTNERYFAWTAHHSAYDGTTISRTLKMVAQVFQGGSCDHVTPITRFVRSLGHDGQNGAWKKSGMYWQKELENAQMTRFPESPSSSHRPFADGVHRRRFRLLPSRAENNTRNVKQGTRVSAAILLRAAWALVVSGSTGDAEAMLAVVLSGRDVPVFGIEDMIAPTITTVPVRVDTDRRKTVVDFLSAVDTQSKEMAPYVQFGLANIRREVPSLGHDFDPGHLFVVHLEASPEDAAATSALGLERMMGERQNFEGYNLVVECSLDDTGTKIEVETHFDPRVLGQARVDELISRLEHIVRELQRYNLSDAALHGNQKSVKVGSLDLVTPEEKQKLLDWNEPTPDALEITLDRLVANQISKSPQGQAVCSRGGDLTYSELDSAADCLARLLVSVGVGPEVFVGVCMEKSVFAVISMLAILRAGGGVVPLGVQHPTSRIESLIANAEITVALVDMAQAQRFSSLVPHSITVDASLLGSLPHLGPDAPALSRASPDDPAWIIFTSGSTGAPKGVVLGHRALCHSIIAIGMRYGMSPATRSFQFSAFTFDASIAEVFTTLSYGGCVCMPSEKDRTDDIIAAMHDFAITFAMLTPTVASLLNPVGVPTSLDTIVFMGEALLPSTVEPWLSRTKCFNGYGPTECSIYSVINGPITRPEDAPIIGSRLSNRLWVTDPLDYNSLVPLGAPGELLIEGHSLARGYLHDSVKTSASFVFDPKFAASLGLQPGLRMYRTGDLVRQDPDTGLVTCLGRLDDQIKIRGQRVEVGEIESQIVRLQPSIQHTFVDLVCLRDTPEPILLAGVELPSEFGIDNDLNVQDGSNQHPLAGTIVRPSQRVNAFLTEIRTGLLRVLPLYMVPAHLIPMSLPLNGSGKLDRRRTRTVIETLDRERLYGFSANYESGQGMKRGLSKTEEQLHLLWTQVLGLSDEESGDVDDDFSKLGGDSVAAMRLVAAARAAAVPLHLGVRQILRNPRLEDMARMVDNSSGDGGDAMSTGTADPKPFELWSGFLDMSRDQQTASLISLAEQCADLAGPDEILDVYPTTALQEGLMAITSRQTSAYVAQQVFRLSEDVDVPRLHRAWELMSSTLAILRTRIVYTAQGSLQIVVKKTTQWMYPNDLISYLAEDQARLFSYGTPLHRVAMVEEGSQRYFVWTMHHAAYDGWSLQLALRMLVQAYQYGSQAVLRQRATPIPRFIRYLKQLDEQALKEYWKGQLEGAQITRFPELPSFTYQPCAASLLETRLKGLSASRNLHNAGATVAPLGVLLRAAWAATVATYTGSDEATINVSLSGRDTPVDGITNVVAPTLTTVPVRIKLDRGQSIDRFLQSVDEQTKEMVSFAHVGLHEIRNAVPGLGTDFDAGHLFIIQPAPTEAESATGLDAIGLELDAELATRSAETRDFGGYALAVDCTVDADSVHIEMRYDSEVLSHSRAAALLSQFEHIIQQLNENRGTSAATKTILADLELLSPIDAATIRTWNADIPPTTHRCIHDLIQESADRTPDAQAVDSWDGQLSYESLMAMARRLAHHLVTQCAIEPEAAVGLCMDKSRWAVVAMLAILMAGGAVVPLGAQAPIGRITTMVRDAAIRVILVDKTHATRLLPLLEDVKKEELSSSLVTVNEPFITSLPQAPRSNNERISYVSSGNAAWVVYTSGSTGTPKGVVMSHRALCSSFAAHGPRVGFAPTTRALQFSAYTFDNAIEDILSVLSFGGCVCVPSEYQRLNDLVGTIRRLRVNLVNATPTMASLLSPADVPLVKTLLLGGETVSPAAVEPWLGYAKVINTYGPAECSVDVACSVPMERARDAYTIGLPLGVNFWVTTPSDYNRLVPIGTPGELLVEGPHLAQGYMNDPEKTARSFVWDPHFVTQLGLSSGRRLYRTGDLVKQNTDGSLVHLGRIDTQIKIHGQRVEIGEIESHIVRIGKKVRIACVDLVRPRDGSGSDPLLVAAIEVGDFGRDEHDEELQTVRSATSALRAMTQNLRDALFLILPHYMVPHFVAMTNLPTNASGKLDRRATHEILAGLNCEQLTETDGNTENFDDRPLTAMENQLRLIWVDMLRCSPNIGANAHFIQLGGDSVIAMRIVAASQGLGIRIGVADILQNPRLSDLARVAQDGNAMGDSEQNPAPFELWHGFSDLDEQLQQARLLDIANRCELAPHEIEDVYPATALQEGLMAVTAEQPDGYFAQFQFRMRGMDTGRFKAAWGKIMTSFSIMRTRIIYDEAKGASVQVVVRDGLTWGHGEDLAAYLAKDKALKFAYGAPLHRLAIVETRQGETYFVWTSHHSGYDGYQIALTLNMLAKLYQDGGDIEPSPPPVSRFIQYLQQKDKKEVASYWKEQLDGIALSRFPPIPYASYRPEADSVSRARIRVRPRGGSGAPVAVLLRAAWALTVGQYTGNPEATSVMALAGREIPVVDIGNMAMSTLTTVPMRTRFSDRKQLVSELLSLMARQSKAMQPFLHTGMQHIRAAVPGLGVDFDPGHLLIVQPTMGDKVADPVQAIGLEELPTLKADFSGYALAVQCMAHPDAMVDVEMLYDSKVLPRKMAEELLLQFEHTIQQLETNGDSAVGDLDLLKPRDVDRIREWNKPLERAIPNRSCIHELVRTMVHQQPDAQAISAWDGDFTYSALSQTASRLAHHLVDLGVGPEVAVGVCMDKSRWAMVSMLAILQAGGVVVGLGTQHPLIRIETIISDAHISVVLVDEAQAQRLGGMLRPTVVDASFVEGLPDRGDPPIPKGLTPDNAAWIVYTSGSTGDPKGVVLSHAALCTGIISHGTIFGNNKRTRALQYASHTFGVVMEDMFTTLIFGGCTCIPSEDTRLDMSDLARTINIMGINFVNLTSTAASMLNPHDVPGLETVVLGGEAVRPAVVDLWLKHAKVLNAYGQSECSVESVISVVEHADDANNIGFPIGGCTAWVVNTSDWNLLVPIGTPGELLIQGPLLARGYLNDSDKTAASFVTDPVFLSRLDVLTGHGHRFYRTGDLVQQNEDGSLVYLGRCDSQIKVRGQRVEPGEIENRIVQLHSEQVSHAFVDVVEVQGADELADPALVAAIELRDGPAEASFGQIGHNTDDNYNLPPTVRLPTRQTTSLMQQIRANLLKELPLYMVPSYFVPMSQHLPVNASGKLDRRATRAIITTLSRHQLEASSRSQKKDRTDRPFSETEQNLRDAYMQVLGRTANDVGLDDHFIELGGDSVAAMQVSATCRQRFGLTVSVRDLLQKQSIAALAPYVRQSGARNGQETLQQLEDGQQSLLPSSHAVTDIQEWMLNYHVARPDVGMTYFSLDGTGSLIGDDRMSDACKRLLTSIESLHTGFAQDKEKGSWRRIVLDPFIPDIRTFVTTDSIEDWTADFMSREGSEHIRPDRPLVNVAICTTTDQHRILFRLSHVIWDGMCIPVFWSTLKELYETGRAAEAVVYSQYVAEVEKLRTPEATRYWTALLEGSSMTPISKTQPRGDDYVYRAAVLGPEVMHVGQRLPHNMTCANVVKAAWSLVLARHAGQSDVIFADLVSGRAGVDPSVAGALGCCSTPIPVRARISSRETYADLVQSLQRQQLESMPYETFGLNSIVRQCTDWPEGTPATSWINHVPTRMAGELDIGGVRYVLGQPATQEEKNWTFSETRISWTQDDTGYLEFHLVYAADRIEEDVARRLYDDLTQTLQRILTAPDALLSERYNN